MASIPNFFERRHHKNRSPRNLAELVFDTLTAISDNTPIKLSHVVKKANLNHGMTIKLLDFLKYFGYVMESKVSTSRNGRKKPERKVFALTQKGIEFKNILAVMVEK